MSNLTTMKARAEKNRTAIKAQAEKNRTVIKAWIEKDIKEQRKLGEKACIAYVNTSVPINGACTVLPKAFDCVNSSKLVPKRVFNNFVQRFEESSESLAGLYGCVASWTYNLSNFSCNQSLPSLDDLAKRDEKHSLVITSTGMLEVFDATKSEKDSTKNTNANDVFVIKLDAARGVDPKKFDSLLEKYEMHFMFSKNRVLLLPGTELTFVSCSKQTKSKKKRRVFRWVATSPKPPKATSNTNNTNNELRFLEALNHYYSKQEAYWLTFESLTTRKCSAKEVKTHTVASPPPTPPLFVAHQEVEAMRLLAKPRFMTVYRGTRLAFPFVVPTSVSLEDMQKQKYFKLDHLLSTSTSKRTAANFTNNNVDHDVSYFESKVKASYLHVMELNGVMGIDVSNVHEELSKQGVKNLPGLMIAEKEILLLPGQEVLFELVKVETSDKVTRAFDKHRKVVKVGDIIPNTNSKPTKLVKKKKLVPDVLIPKKRKAHQMMDKTKHVMNKVDALHSDKAKLAKLAKNQDYLSSDFGEQVVKDGNVVLYWNVSVIPAWPLEPKELRDLYDKDTAFPSWACIKELNLDFRATRVFYDAKDKLLDVKRLALEREPCNILMTKNFDEAKLQKKLGYSESYYTRWARQHAKRLPPNIAVYVKTHVNMEQVAKLVPNRPTTSTSWFSQGKKQEDALFKRVHLISLVGLAFDHPSQPDFEVLGDTPSLSKLIGTYACVWQKAFECAKYWNLPTIVATQVGNGAFKPPNLSYQEFKLGVHDKVLSNLKKAYPGVNVVEPRNVFNMIYKLDQAKLDNLLFVNSWDPHSMLGNGNRIDDSLDGKFGRCSAIAVLGWPGTNLHVRYKPI
jgi:hypothetical protein